MNSSPINQQTPAPLSVGDQDRYIHLYAGIERNGSKSGYAIADVNINDWDTKNPIISRETALCNAALLQSAYTAFDKAGRELGIDANQLAQWIDLGALIRAVDFDTLEAIADEIGGDFKHSARADSLRAIAKAQREALGTANTRA